MRRVPWMKLAGAAMLVLALCACAAPTGLSPSMTATAQPMAPTAPGQLTNTPSGLIRPAAVAGSWYPGDPDQLAGAIDEMLGSIVPIDGELIGLVVPHDCVDSELRQLR